MMRVMKKGGTYEKKACDSIDYYVDAGRWMGLLNNKGFEP